MIEAHSKTAEFVEFLTQLNKDAEKAITKHTNRINASFEQLRPTIIEHLDDILASKQYKDEHEKYLSPRDSKYVAWLELSAFKRMFVSEPIDDREQLINERLEQAIKNDRERIDEFLDGSGHEIIKNVALQEMVNVYSMSRMWSPPYIIDHVVQVISQRGEDLFEIHRKIEILVSDKVKIERGLALAKTHKYDSITIDENALSAIERIQKSIK